MNYKLTSSKAILAKIYRDFKPNNANWEQDAVEWIGEVIEFIGYPGNFPKKKVVLTVKDHRTAFPCDFYQIRHIKHNAKRLPFGGDPLRWGEYFEEDVFMSAKKEVLEHTNTEVTRLGSKAVSSFEDSEDFYVINPGFIQTSFETGEIVLHYDAFPVDEDNLPLIPDNVYFREATIWYILRMMMLGGYKHDNFNFEYVDQKWDWAKVRAENELMFPSPEKVEHFKNMWVRLVPMIDESGRDEFYNL